MLNSQNNGQSLVTEKTSRNNKYEQNKKDSGLVKITVWIPEDSQIEFKQMANYCCENRGHIPFQVRSLITGRMAKAI